MFVRETKVFYGSAVEDLRIAFLKNKDVITGDLAVGYFNPESQPPPFGSPSWANDYGIDD
ncbi:hypothetical protein BMS3Abin15_00968 [bacterium BMS3Abin15]|nr:hypothetical protein BMS3Abin15_00968 [bacterium BMS3Abin15]